MGSQGDTALRDGPSTGRGAPTVELFYGLLSTGGQHTSANSPGAPSNRFPHGRAGWPGPPGSGWSRGGRGCVGKHELGALGLIEGNLVFKLKSLNRPVEPRSCISQRL